MVSDNAFSPVDPDSINLDAPAFAPISAEQLEIIKSAPEPRRGGKTKNERLWGERTLKSWWELPTTADTCDYCEHGHMCAETVDGKKICRRCFVVSNDKLPTEERIPHDWPPGNS